jgi:hypothetical protein
MRTTLVALSVLLTTSAGCGPIDITINPAGDGTGWHDETTGDAQSGSTGLDGSDTGAPSGTGSDGESTSGGESSSGAASESTTGSECSVVPLNPSVLICSCDGGVTPSDPSECGCFYDAAGVCHCDDVVYPEDVCAPPVPSCAVEVFGGSEQCVCDGLPALPEECGCVFTGQCFCDDGPAAPSACGCVLATPEVCVCGVDNYPPEVCEPEPQCVPGLPCWCEDLVPPQPCPAAADPITAACECFISPQGCVCPEGVYDPGLCQPC